MTDTDKISVIIPCLNKEENLKELIPYLLQHWNELLSKIIVVDEGSEDISISRSISLGALVVQSPICNRASKLNLGAQHAKGSIFYFVHADTRPVGDYSKVILESISQRKEVGCFRYRFESESTLLKFNSGFTRFNGVIWRRRPIPIY